MMASICVLVRADIWALERMSNKVSGVSGVGG